MKIVLTGGPSAGKTSIVDILYRNDSEQIVVVEEAASILYRGGFPRSVQAEKIKSQQFAIYAVQRALEEIRSLDSEDRTLVCDRGSLDGLAYWPGTEESFFKCIHSTMETELARYEWVIHLDSAASEDYQISKVRIEKSLEAAKLNELVKTAWRKHPQRLVVPNSNDFMKKVSTVLRCLSLIQEKRSAAEIRSLLGL